MLTLIKLLTIINPRHLAEYYETVIIVFSKDKRKQISHGNIMVMVIKSLKPSEMLLNNFMETS